MKPKTPKLPRAITRYRSSPHKFNNYKPPKDYTKSKLWKIETSEEHNKYFIYPMLKIDNKWYPLFLDGEQISAAVRPMRINGIEIGNTVQDKLSKLHRELTKWLKLWLKAMRIDAIEEKSKEKKEKEKKAYPGEDLKPEDKDDINRDLPKPIVTDDQEGTSDNYLMPLGS